jgi:hypothetical protein
VAFSYARRREDVTEYLCLNYHLIPQKLMLYFSYKKGNSKHVGDTKDWTIDDKAF